MNLTLKQLESFVCVADLGSFKRAAQKLNTTQPNISSRIAALEENLGVSLMERDAGSVRLTASGENLLAKARRVLNAVDDFVGSAGSRELYDGVIRVGVTEMVAHTWLNIFLKEFKLKFPNVSLELIVDLAANLETELHEKTVDLTFQSGPFTNNMSGNLKLGEFPMVWVAAVNSDLANKHTVDDADLRSSPIITHARNTLAYKEVNAHFAKQKGGAAKLVPCSNLLVSAQMVVDGYGTGVLLKPIVERFLNSKELVELDYGWAPNRLAFFARYDANTANQIVAEAAQMAQTISLDVAKKYAE